MRPSTLAAGSRLAEPFFARPSIVAPARRAHPGDDPNEKGAHVIRLLFDCPQTGELIRTGMRFGGWPEQTPRSLISLHCPKCGGTHRFRQEDAIYAMDAEAGTAQLAASAA